METYRLTMWLPSKSENMWLSLSAAEISRFEKEYAAFLASDNPKAVFVLITEEKRRTIRLDWITDFVIVQETD